MKWTLNKKAVNKTPVSPNIKHLISMRQQLTLLLLILLSIPAMAQDPETPPAQQPATSETPAPDPYQQVDRVVRYDYGTKMFLDILPFDVPFTIRVVNLPGSVTKLTARSYELRGNFNFYKKNIHTITEETVLNDKRVHKFSTAEWERSEGWDSNYANLPVVIGLAPNSKFLFYIGPTQRIPLKDEEKEKLSNKLFAEKKFNTLLNRTAKEALANSGNISAQIKKANFKDFINSFVMNENPEYRFSMNAQKEKDMEDVLLEYFQAFAGFNSKLEQLTRSANLTDAIKSTFRTLYDKLNQNPKWSDISNGKIKDIEIDDFLESIDEDKMASSDKDAFEDVKRAIEDAVNSTSKLARKFIDQLIKEHLYRETALASTYCVKMTDQAPMYIGLDVGYAYISNFSQFSTYTGLNIYFRPVNKHLPLSVYKRFMDVIATRTSLLLGITIESVTKTGIRKGLINNNGVILGAGFRLNSWFRVNGGTVLYYLNHNNPIINTDRYRAKASPFVSLSIDIDVRNLIGGLAQSVFKNQ